MPCPRRTTAIRRAALTLAFAAVSAACSASTAARGPAPTATATRAGSTAGAGTTTSPTSTTSPAAATTAAGSDWASYHGGLSRAGYAPTAPDPANARVVWTRELDAPSYASPLVVGGLVLQATSAGTLYGLDAAGGQVRWHTSLAEPVTAAALPCGNIDRLGVIGTPAYDAATGQVFAVTATPGEGGGSVRHVLYGVDARTGAVRSTSPADAPGSNPATHLQRAALAVAGGRVYIAYGGNYGDCGDYLGRVVAARTDGTGEPRTFAVPTRREAGIWAASGPAVLADGSLLVTTGNGEATGGAWDHSDSLLRLSPNLALLDGFAPAGWAQENSVDADLGSTGPVVLPDGRSAVVAGKGGSVFLLDTAHLGGVGGERAHLSGCRSYGGAAAIPGPAGSSLAGVVLPCSDGLLQVVVRGNALLAGWRAPPQVTGSPVIAGTTVWSLQQDGALVGLDLATGTPRVSLQVGDATRFSTPASSGGRLFVATRRGVTAVALR